MHHSKQPTALIVETNYLIAAGIAATLAAASYHVVIATTAEEAFTHLAEGKIQIALIDFRLQHGDPEGLVAKLNAYQVPFLFCTAASPEEVLEVFPGVHVIPKPFSDEELLQAVSRVATSEGLSTRRGEAGR